MDLARFIDHTLLRQDCTSGDIVQLCDEAVQHSFAAVCVPPFYVKEVANLLEKKTPKIATVVGFPMGYSATPAKVEEIKRAIDEGAHELDAVVNVCAVKNGSWNYVRNEIESLTTASHMKGRVLKVIFETGLLQEKEILKLCDICSEAGVDFVKTSTGFAAQGASVDVVAMLRRHLPKTVKIKASGGIRDRQFAEQLIAAGADRIGCSSSLHLIGVAAHVNS